MAAAWAGKAFLCTQQQNYYEVPIELVPTCNVGIAHCIGWQF